MAVCQERLAELGDIIKFIMDDKLQPACESKKRAHTELELDIIDFDGKRTMVWTRTREEPGEGLELTLEAPPPDPRHWEAPNEFWKRIGSEAGPVSQRVIPVDAKVDPAAPALLDGMVRPDDRAGNEAAEDPPADPADEHGAHHLLSELPRGHLVDPALQVVPHGLHVDLEVHDPGLQCL